MASQTVSDLIYTKLKARYPTLYKPTINDLIRKFRTDNPSVGVFGSGKQARDFYGGTEKSVGDKAYRYFTNLVP